MSSHNTAARLRRSQSAGLFVIVEGGCDDALSVNSGDYNGRVPVENQPVCRVHVWPLGSSSVGTDIATPSSKCHVCVDANAPEILIHARSTFFAAL